MLKRRCELEARGPAGFVVGEASFVGLRKLVTLSAIQVMPNLAKSESRRQEMAG